MIRYRSYKQLPLSEFWPFQVALDENNRWVKMSECIPGMNWRKVIIKVFLSEKVVLPKMRNWWSVP